MSIEIQATDAIGSVGGTSTHAPQLSLEGKTVYLAGPMSGRPDFNRAAFHRVAAALRRSAHGVAEVINPAEVELPAGATWEEYMAVGLAGVARADLVVVLPGWTGSRGASIEVATARALGLPVVAASLVLPVGDVGETPAWESPEALARVVARFPRVCTRFLSDESDLVLARDAEAILDALFDDGDELAPAGMVLAAGYALEGLLSVFRLVAPALSPAAAWLQMGAITGASDEVVGGRDHLFWGSWLALAPHQRGEFTLMVLDVSQDSPEECEQSIRAAARLLLHAAVCYVKFAAGIVSSGLASALREAGVPITEVGVEQ
ncbi:MAG: DUF4406 domain-containing protein [Buchananella hordeovulneris]|nr:DUF4406 domain-containing protein [Buchananella hordeovulneris]